MNKFLTSAFILGGIAAGSVAISPSTFATTQSCVDGTVSQNLVTTITKDFNTVTVSTKDNAPLCKDLTLYWDSYTMPDAYDGTGFNSPTATPQTQYDHHVVTMKAGEHTATATLKQPVCKNVQVDLYYGPEMKTVTAAGHGVQFVNGGINGDITRDAKRDLEACKVPVTPVTPATPVTPTTPVTPVAPVETPAKGAGEATVELPSTGSNEIATGAIATILAAAAYGAAFIASKKRAL